TNTGSKPSNLRKQAPGGPSRVAQRNRHSPRKRGLCPRNSSTTFTQGKCKFASRRTPTTAKPATKQLPNIRQAHCPARRPLEQSNSLTRLQGKNHEIASSVRLYAC